MELLNSSVLKRLTYGFTLIGILALLVATIWWFGPTWGIGDVYPLSPIVNRCLLVMSIILLGVMEVYRLPTLLFVLVVLINLIWIVGPYCSIGQLRPFMDMAYRLLGCIVLLSVGIGYLLWQWLLRLSADPQPVFARLSALHPAQLNDFAELKSVFAQWHKVLKERQQIRSWFWRFIWSKESVQSLPWTMLIGPSASGKTSALLAAELAFPLPAQQIQATIANTSHQQCQFWLTNHSIWLDTPGRYFDPSNPARSEWQTLIEQLPAKNSLSAVETVVLVFDCKKLWTLSPEQLIEYAACYRENILLLQAKQQAQLSIYLLVTQLDLLSGFSDYFSSMEPEEKEQVLGVNFRSILTGSDPYLTVIEQSMIDLALRIEKGTLFQQQMSVDLAARKRIELFAEDFSRLIKLTYQFIQQLMPHHRVTDSELDLTLDGVYFSSSQLCDSHSVRHPNSLIGQWLAKQAAFRQCPTEISEYEPEIFDLEATYAVQRSGYFIKQFFDEVVVNESQYRQEKRQRKFVYRLKRVWSLSIAMPLAAIIIYLLALSYQHNQTYLAGQSIQLEQLEQRLIATELPLDQSLTRLNSLIAGQGISDITSVFSAGHYGLYTGNQFIEFVTDLYNQWLISYLLPMIEQVTIEALEQNIEAGQSERLFAALHSYLMLVGDVPVETPTITSWLVSATRLPTIMNDSDALSAMIQRLFSVPWSSQRPAANPTLIRTARQLLQQQPLDAYLYQRLKQRALVSGLPAVGLPQLVNYPQAPLFEIVEGQKDVIGLFTLPGYRYWQQQVLTEDFLIDRALVESVIFERTARFDSETQEKLWKEISARYLVDYRTAWQGFISSMRLNSSIEAKKPFGQATFYSFHYMLKNFSGTESQLRKLLENISLQTQLVTAQSLSNNPAVEADRQPIFLDESQLSAAVDSHFLALHQFVAPLRHDTQLSLDNFEKTLNQLYLLLAMADPTSGGQGVLPLVDWSVAINKLAVQIKQMPEPLGQLFLPVLLGTDQQVKRLARQASNKQIDQDIIQFCQKNLMGRYPFAPVAAEVSLQAFTDMFGPNGKLTSYFNQYLLEIVDTHRHPWRFTSQSAAISPRFLAMFEQGSLLQQQLFSTANGKLGLELNLAVSHLAPSITQLLVDINQQRLRYLHGPKRWSSVYWPTEASHPLLQIRAVAADGQVIWEQSESGNWGMFRWLEKAQQRFDPLDQQTELTFGKEPQQAVIQLTGLNRSVTDVIRLLRQFRCASL